MDRTDHPTAVDSARREPRCLVFDIGGTSIRAAAYARASRTIECTVREETSSHWLYPDCSLDELQERLYAQMVGMGRAIFGDAAPDQVVAAFPGPVDGHGDVGQCPTLWGPLQRDKTPVRAHLQACFPGAKVHVLNDVTAAGYRYIERGDEDLCIVTVSSGIGNKVFLAGAPVLGPDYMGGEIGHWRVEQTPDAAPCDCGESGHLAALASGRGVLRAARARMADHPGEFQRSLLSARLGFSCLDNRMLVAGYQAGDAWVEDIIRHTARPLGLALAAIHLAIGVQRFIIMGGFACALGEGYRVELARAARAAGGHQGLDWNRAVELCREPQEVGLLGAGRYAVLHAERAPGEPWC